MSRGYQLTDGQMKAVRETVRTVRSLFRGGERGPQHFQGQRRLTAVTAGALTAATNASTTPSSVNVYIVERDSTGNMVYTGRSETVYCTWEQIEAIPQYTLVKIVRENRRWELDNADCDALSAATRTSMGLP